MDSLAHAARRRTTKPARLSRLSSITRADDLSALGLAANIQEEIAGSEANTDWTLDVQPSLEQGQLQSTEDEECSFEPSYGQEAAQVSPSRGTPASLTARKSITKRSSFTLRKNRSSSSEEMEQWLEDTAVAVSPLRTTSDSESDTSDAPAPASGGTVKYLGRTPNAKPPPLDAAGDSATHMGKIPLLTMAALTKGAESLAAFPTQVETRMPHMEAMMHVHKPAGFLDTVHGQPSASSHIPSKEGLKMPPLKIKGPAEPRQSSSEDAFFIPESPTADRVSSPRISSWAEQQAGEPAEQLVQQSGPRPSLWDRRMARIGSTKPRPSLDLKQADLHPTLRDQSGSVSLTSADIQKLEGAVDAVLQISPKPDAWENLGDGKTLEGERQASSQASWSAVLQQPPEPWCVLGTARFQRRLEDDGIRDIEELDLMDTAMRAALGQDSRMLGGTGAVSIVQRGGFGVAA